MVKKIENLCEQVAAAARTFGFVLPGVYPSLLHPRMDLHLVWCAQNVPNRKNQNAIEGHRR